MHHCRGIGNTTVVAVSKRGHVTFAHVLDHLQQVGLDIKLARFTSVVADEWRSCVLRPAQGVIVTALVAVSSAVGLGLEQFIGEDAIAPTTIIIKQRQGANGLVENIEVSSVSSRRCAVNKVSRATLKVLGAVASVGSAGPIFLQVDKNLIFNNRAARCSAQSLVSSTLSESLLPGLPQKRYKCYPKSSLSLGSASLPLMQVRLYHHLNK